MTNKISPEGGLTEKMRRGHEYAGQPSARPWSSSPIAEKSLPRPIPGVTAYLIHVRNWMECVRSRKKPNAPVEAGYNHSIANIMTNAAVHTGAKATFDEKTQEVMAGEKVFKY